MRTALKRVTLALLVAFVGCGAYSYHQYRGMTLGMINHMRHATIGESMNLMFCIRYWLTFMEKLRYDETTSSYSFGESLATGATGFDACTKAFHQGDFEIAVDCLERDIEENGESEARLFWLGMSYLRQAEAVNCLSALRDADAPFSGMTHGHEHQAYCILPLRRHHDRTDFSSRAMTAFQKLLDEHDADNRLHQWLLNFSAMTIDAFPEGVPERYRVDSDFIELFYGAPASRMAERYADLAFVDRAAELGVDTFNTGRGVAIEDFDRDGDLDIVTGGSFHVVRYYRNEDGARFTDRTAEAGLGGVTQPFVISAADYDNDGWVDVFVGRPFDCFRLFRNHRDGTFRDVTETSGLLDTRNPEQVTATWVSAWGDVDNDGDLDLFLAQWNFRMPFLRGLMGKSRMDPKLFLNEAGRFTDVTHAYGLRDVTRDQYYIGAAFGDYDNDGFTDLYLSSPLRRTSVLLRNEEGQRFRRADLTNRGESGFVTAFVDVDHDGRLDIFQSGFSDATSSTEQAVFGDHLDSYHSGRSTILLQNESGSFDEHNDFFSGHLPMSTMGSSYGDLDNDGCYDFYLGTGNPEGWFVLPNLMYVGRREGRRCTGAMDNVSMLEGFGTIQKGHGIVFFDFDNDGDQDVYSSLGGMWPGDSWPNQLFVNESRLDNAWVKVRLRGRQTNYYGVGARLEVVAEAADGSEIVRRYHMDNKTGFGSAPYLAQIGLLDARRIREIEVYWPASRCTSSYPARLYELNVLDEKMCSDRAGGTSVF